MSVDLIKLRQAINKGQVEWRKHTLQRLAERHISQKATLHALLTGEVIRDYDDDRPFPSILVLGWIDDRPLHVVASYDDSTSRAYIITVYEPSLSYFESDFKTKKQ